MSVFSDALLTELVTRLRSAIPNSAASIIEFPDQPEPKQFTHGKAAVWVGYSGSVYDPPESIGVPVQRREMRFEITLLTRKLNGPQGVTALLESVRELLHGHRLSVGSPLSLLRDGFVRYADGVWRHSIMLATTLPSVPASTASDDGELVNLVRARFEHAEETFDVPPPEEP